MEGSPPRLFALIEPRRAAWLGLLMLAGALTEGIGLVLLVPLLAVLGGESSGRLGTWLEASGIPLQLEALLALFVVLVGLRAAIAQARLMATQRFELALVDGLRRRAWRALLHCDWRVLVGMRRADSASLLISDVERIGFGVQQAIAAIAIVVTLAGIGLAALAISPAAVPRRWAKIWARPMLPPMPAWAKAWMPCARSRAWKARTAPRQRPWLASPRCAAPSWPMHATVG
jgi:ATP-binding cassette, subfamily C, bacterial